MRLFNRTNKYDELKETIVNDNNKIYGKIDKIYDKLESLIITQDSEFKIFNKKFEALQEENKKLKERIWNITINKEETIENQKTETYKKSYKITNKTLNQSKSKTTSGILYVSYDNKTGLWKHQIPTKKETYISSPDLKALEQKVKDKGYDWVIVNNELAKYSYNHNKPKTENSNILLKPKTENKNNTRANGGKQRTTIKENPNDNYQYSKSYKKILNWKIFPDGLIGNKTYKKGQYESYQLLNIYKTLNFPLKNKDYTKVKALIENYGLTLFTGFRFAYTLQVAYEKCKGQILDEVMYPIYENYYDVPFFVDFGVNNDGFITVNGKTTNIHKKTLTNMFYDINQTIHPKALICILMHDNQDLNQKELFYCLNNYGNNKLKELL